MSSVNFCAGSQNWALTLLQGSTFQRVLDFGEIDMTGIALRGAIARRPGAALLASYTFTTLSDYVEGADLAVNGAFAADSDWTKGAGVTIATGAATFTTVAAGLGLTASVAPLIAGRLYAVDLSVANYAAGGLEVLLGATRVAVPLTGDGDYRVFGTASSALFSVRAVGTTSLALDNLSIREITPCRIQVGLTATQTAALPAGQWWHDVEAYTANGWVLRILSGPVTVSAEVTR